MKSFLVVLFDRSGGYIESYVELAVRSANIRYSARFANMLSYCRTDVARAMIVSDGFDEIKMIDL